MSRSEHFTTVPPVVAAGTWGGYAPLVAAASRRATTGYRIETGLSDRDRAQALLSGRAAAVLISAQALIGWLREYAEKDLIVIHAFGRSNCAEVEDHLLLRAGMRLGMPLRWAIPGEGLEKEVIRRLDPTAVSARLISRHDRRDCVEAVMMGDVDACMINQHFAESVIADHRGVPVEWMPLPEDIWSDIWVLLIARRNVVIENERAYADLLRELTEDALVAQRSTGEKIIYLDLKQSFAALSDGTIAAAFSRWGAPEVGPRPAWFEMKLLDRG